MKTPHQILVPGRVVRIAMMLLAPLALYPQGALTPPGGPAPMMKTLQQVEPRIDLATVDGTPEERHLITDSGSYYLTEDITYSPGSRIINIQADNVTLDLNGYSITAGCPYAIVVGEVTNLVIRNGTITGGFTYAVYISETNTGQMTFEGLRILNPVRGIVGSSARLVVRDCVLVGQGVDSIYGVHAGNGSLVRDTLITGFASSSWYACALKGDGSVKVENCTLTDSYYGAWPGAGSLISLCTVTGNTGAGIRTDGAGITVSNCDVSGNGSYGIWLSDTGTSSNSHVMDCRIEGNSGYGIYTSYNAQLQVERCTISSNGSAGIYTNQRATVSDCLVAWNSGNQAIRVFSQSVVTRCKVLGNYSSNTTSYGIYAGDYSTIEDCTVTDTTNTNSPSNKTQGVGIRAGSNSVVQNCVVRSSTGDGILVDVASRVVGNTCIGNGWPADPNRDGAGIHASLYGCIIDGNMVYSNVRGIDIDSGPNVVTRNYARSNTTNYDLAAGNRVGPIVSSPASVAISGSTGGAGLGSTDPWANFSY